MGIRLGRLNKQSESTPVFGRQPRRPPDPRQAPTGQRPAHIPTLFSKGDGRLHRKPVGRNEMIEL